MASTQFHGVTAAVLTPRLASGEVDVVAFRGLLEFLLLKGIRSFALNGATGEYILSDQTQLRSLLRVANEVIAGGGQILCGVGAGSTAQSVALGQVAQDAKIAGILLPMPYFFSYQQGDLAEFCRSIANTVTIPVLLYNLPVFTTPLEKETAAGLIASVPNIVGIKDSSGSLDILSYLREGCRIIGDDSILPEALLSGHCDGVVSGVAGVWPELILALYAETDPVEFGRLSHSLSALIQQLRGFPVPWGLKYIARARGIFDPAFSLPRSSQRVQQGEDFTHWLRRAGL